MFISLSLTIFLELNSIMQPQKLSVLSLLLSTPPKHLGRVLLVLKVKMYRRNSRSRNPQCALALLNVESSSSAFSTAALVALQWNRPLSASLLAAFRSSSSRRACDQLIFRRQLQCGIAMEMMDVGCWWLICEGSVGSVGVSRGFNCITSAIRNRAFSFVKN